MRGEVDCPEHTRVQEHVVNRGTCGARLARVRGRIGDYELVRTLPTITPGILEYEAMHVLLPRRAHVRVIAAGDPHRVMREACILEALAHPGVPRVYECGRLRDRRPWIALELLDGPTLADAVTDRPLLAADMLAVVRDVAEILDYAHVRGVVHGRLRPAFIVRCETGLFVSGWAAASTPDSQPPIEPGADIQALGVIAYEALALAPPTLPLARRVPALPRALCALVDRMATGNELARPTAAEVRAEAIRLLDQPAEDIVEEIEIELPPPRAMRWTPSYQPTIQPGDPLDPRPTRRR